MTPVETLLQLLDDLWSWVPEDRRDQVARVLRGALESAPVGASDKRLGETGCVLVTARALGQYGEERRLPVEEARRELTAALLDAKRVATGDDEAGERWRARRQGSLDITARVAREGRLAIVTSIGTPRRRSRRRDPPLGS